MTSSPSSATPTLLRRRATVQDPTRRISTNDEGFAREDLIVHGSHSLRLVGGVSTCCPGISPRSAMARMTL